MTLDDKIVVLDKGVISQQGTPLELYNRPANKFVASFIGSPAMNFFTATASGQTGNSISVSLPGGKTATVTSRGGKLPANGAVEIGVRPEHLRLGAPGAPGSAFDGKINIVEQLGNSTLAYVDTPAGLLIAEGEGNLQVSPGDTTSITIDAAHTHLFGSDNQVI